MFSSSSLLWLVKMATIDFFPALLSPSLLSFLINIAMLVTTMRAFSHEKRGT